MPAGITLACLHGCCVQMEHIGIQLLGLFREYLGLRWQHAIALL